MKIYTRTGDSGQTSLWGGQRVDKDDLRIEAYGTVDELNAFLGLLLDEAGPGEQQSFMRQVQECLFSIGAHLAAGDAKKPPLTLDLDRHIGNLEKEMDQMNEGLPALKNFILPGGEKTASFCHTARTICRRAERRVVGLNRQSPLEVSIIRYLNRLSDYLFVLARHFTHVKKGEETPWIPAK